jgi:catalase-peroxidase
MAPPDAHAPASGADDDDDADMALKVDPAYRAISERFRDDPRSSSPTPSPAPGSSCCHRDMGPKVRYLGPEVPRRT